MGGDQSTARLAGALSRLVLQLDPTAKVLGEMWAQAHGMWWEVYLATHSKTRVERLYEIYDLLRPYYLARDFDEYGDYWGE